MSSFFHLNIFFKTLKLICSISTKLNVAVISSHPTLPWLKDGLFCCPGPQELDPFLSSIPGRQRNQLRETFSQHLCSR